MRYTSDFPSAGIEGDRARKKHQVRNDVVYLYLLVFVCIYVYISFIIHLSICTPATLSTSKNRVAFVLVCARARALVYKRPAGAFLSEGRLREVSLFFPLSLIREATLLYIIDIYSGRCVAAGT